MNALMGVIYRLQSGTEHEMLVVPFELHHGHAICVVVASKHPRYPVGGYHISVPDDQLTESVSVDVTGDAVRELVSRCRNLLAVLRCQPEPRLGEWNWPMLADDLEEALKPFPDESPDPDAPIDI